jgi:hypothetical protein
VYGTASVAFGLIALVWHDYHNWDQLRYVAAAVQIVGGIAIQFSRTEKMGAVGLGAVYLVFALVCVPRIVRTPQIYDAWGNFFESLSLATGAALVASRAPIGRILMGICVLSFALEQAFYLNPTAELVPKWLPPNQLFWAEATTVLFGLAAIALLTNLIVRLATRLLVLMLVSFGAFVWIPIVLTHPQRYANWGETIETFAIAGAVWILADLQGAPSLAGSKSASRMGAL